MIWVNRKTRDIPPHLYPQFPRGGRPCQALMHVRAFCDRLFAASGPGLEGVDDIDAIDSHPVLKIFREDLAAAGRRCRLYHKGIPKTQLVQAVNLDGLQDMGSADLD